MRKCRTIRKEGYGYITRYTVKPIIFNSSIIYDYRDVSSDLDNSDVAKQIHHKQIFNNIWISFENETFNLHFMDIVDYRDSKIKEILNEV